MKVRESGMPMASVWDSFFTPEQALEALGLRSDAVQVVDIGCGYGTFTIPAALKTSGTVHAFDIEQPMLDHTRQQAGLAGCRNIELHLRDILADGTGLGDATTDYVMLFNLLHAEHPERLLMESLRILVPGGRLAIMHWNHDPDTPRGPPMAIRPRPADCVRWAKAAGFEILAERIDLPPYHYGVLARRA